VLNFSLFLLSLIHIYVILNLFDFLHIYIASFHFYAHAFQPLPPGEGTVAVK